jgi:hypothetical protein
VALFISEKIKIIQNFYNKKIIISLSRLKKIAQSTCAVGTADRQVL